MILLLKEELGLLLKLWEILQGRVLHKGLPPNFTSYIKKFTKKSKLIKFYPGFLMILGKIEVNQLAWTCLILEQKFGNDQ